MTVTQIKVTESNLIEVSQDPNVLVIGKYEIFEGFWRKDAPQCKVSDLLDPEHVVLKINY